MPNTLPEIPLSLSQSIARQEGWYIEEETRNQRNLNPGNIDYGSFTRAHGATGTDGRFAIFPDAETGFACLVALLHTPGYIGKTIAQAISVYAPSNENDTLVYINNVCEWMRVPSTSILSDIRI